MALVITSRLDPSSSWASLSKPLIAADMQCLSVKHITVWEWGGLSLRLHVYVCITHVCTYVCIMYVQWNPYNADTIGAI